MRQLKYMLLTLVLVLLLPWETDAATLQSKIERAVPGETIEISEGIYEENLIITKPITLKGQGEVLIRSCEEQPAITIKGEHVSLEQIQVEYCGEGKEATAISISGSKHQLTDFEIETKRYGIRLDKAREVNIQDGFIIGQRKGNGIDLWESSHNTIQNMKIAKVQDGIYLEQSHQNTLRQNHIQGSRYGMHLMFADDNVLEKNIAQYNMTGTMLMRVNRVQVVGNDFSYNRDNVNAQGLLIYFVENSRITENSLTGNRVGIYMETSEENVMANNKVMDNFIGVQFTKANNNQLTQNTFVGNVNEAQAIESSNNEIHHNYWDASAKLDLKGKGESIFPFVADPYFLTLTADVPEFQLFFQSPGVLLLQKMLKSPADQVLTDEAPLMETTMEVERTETSASALWMMSVGMMIVSTSLFIVGRKRV
ncbi:right-handed parallel beta-helix repeat-containing protein [Peribacillus asahii]|uniref:right-handed parallel beta-helix repeat-containing protein n=1 Tax=Peribacillus asahii TaxID=228899 RepID=UPI002079D674|nr:NosD domain-containing protein [Peribacillus asahii]USK69839.1 right-handed parallel beta-helix repeat-containing protein [Peribacillus asahii]